ETADDGVAAGDQNVGVAGPPWADAGGDGMAGHLAGRLDNFLHTEAAALAVIVLPATFLHRAQSPDVSLGTVHVLAVGAHAGDVGCVVVVAEDGDLIALTQGHLEDEGDEVGLRVVVLAPLLRRAAGVEITQASVAESVDAIKPVEIALHDVLRFAVRAAGND